MKKLRHVETSCLLTSRVCVLFRQVTRISHLLFKNCFSINDSQNDHSTTKSPLMCNSNRQLLGVQAFELFPKPGKISQAHLFSVLKAGKSSSHSLHYTSLPNFRYPSVSPLHSHSVLKGSVLPKALLTFPLIPALQST